MKQLIFCVVAILCSYSSVFAQSNTQTEPRAPKTTLAPGSVLQTQTIWIGKLKSLSFALTKQKDLMTKKEQNALLLDYKVFNELSGTNSSSIYVEKAEVEEWLAFIQILEKDILPETHKFKTETVFTSTYGLVFGAVYEFDRWKIYLMLKPEDPYSRIDLKKQDIPELNRLLMTSLKHL